MWYDLRCNGLLMPLLYNASDILLILAELLIYNDACSTKEQLGTLSSRYCADNGKME